MKPDLRFDFVVSEDQKSLTVHREFEAHRQLVWDCYTKRELLDQWYAPKPLTTRTKHMDFREGGYWHFAMISPDGQQFWSRMDYVSIQPIDGYTARDGFTDETGVVNPEMPTSDLNVSFTDAGQRTLVTTVVQYASSEALQAVLKMGLKDGLASTLERLDELLPKLKTE